ncbi:MAG: hypothetical protein KC996_03435 [Phycisphaerales bacterium]|nr:hypothetical protein [Phycisphaerales bacterium]
MSQFGMQMPGGRASKGAGPDVYTALMFLGVVSMLVAVGMLWVAGSKVSPEGNPLKIQDAKRIELKK